MPSKAFHKRHSFLVPAESRPEVAIHLMVSLPQSSQRREPRQPHRPVRDGVTIARRFNAGNVIQTQAESRRDD